LKRSVWLHGGSRDAANAGGAGGHALATDRCPGDTIHEFLRSGGPSRITTRAAPWLLITLGSLGFLGVVSMIASDAFGSLSRQGYHPLSQTISLLARHRGNIAQDVGLYILGLGTLAAGLGLRLMIWSGFERRLTVTLVTAAGADIFVLTAFDVLVGDFPHADTIHIFATGVLAVGAIALAFLFASMMEHRVTAYARWSGGAGAAILALSAAYFMVPTAWRGLVERLDALAGLALLSLFAWILVTRDARIQRTD
jgi:hypothetical protein